jgi:hypothetical protein
MMEVERRSVEKWGGGQGSAEDNEESYEIKLDKF